MRFVAILFSAALAACTVPRAAFEGDLTRIGSHLAEGRGVDERFDDGGCDRCTLLHFAALGGQVDVAGVLLSKGADANALDRLGQTPLHLACGNQELEMVRFLLGHGAGLSTSMRDSDGATPLLRAAGSVKVREGVSIIPVGPGGVTAVPATTSARAPDGRILEALLDAGAYVDAANADGFTPLSVAGFNGYTATAGLLLERGADPNKPNRKGNTPLHIAAFRGHAGTVRLLLERGADPSRQNARGETAEALALFFKKPKVVEVLRGAAGR